MIALAVATDTVVLGAATLFRAAVIDVAHVGSDPFDAPCAPLSRVLVGLAHAYRFEGHWLCVGLSSPSAFHDRAFAHRARRFGWTLSDHEHHVGTSKPLSVAGLHCFEPRASIAWPGPEHAFALVLGETPRLDALTAPIRDLLDRHSDSWTATPELLQRLREGVGERGAVCLLRRTTHGARSGLEVLGSVDVDVAGLVPMDVSVSEWRGPDACRVWDPGPRGWNTP